MVLTPSTMLELGTKAPKFELIDVISQEKINLNHFAGKKAFLVIFMCCHCPFVKHIEKEIGKIGHDYQEQNLGILAISANDVEKYPDDSPEKLREMAKRLEFNFPVAYDETQEVAKAYTAACTPDFFLFNRDFELVYRGQLDDSRPSNDLAVNGKDLREAIDAVLANKEVNSDQKPSIGCNIKWKAGNEPNYS